MSYLLIYGRPAARDILSEAGIRNLVIMDYFAEQLLERMRDNLICIT